LVTGRRARVSESRPGRRGGRSFLGEPPKIANSRAFRTGANARARPPISTCGGVTHPSTRLPPMNKLPLCLRPLLDHKPQDTYEVVTFHIYRHKHFSNHVTSISVCTSTIAKQQLLMITARLAQENDSQKVRGQVDWLQLVCCNAYSSTEIDHANKIMTQDQTQLIQKAAIRFKWDGRKRFSPPVASEFD
jgi:hypothetical protein